MPDTHVKVGLVGILSTPKRTWTSLAGRAAQRLDLVARQFTGAQTQRRTRPFAHRAGDKTVITIEKHIDGLGDRPYHINLCIQLDEEGCANVF